MAGGQMSEQTYSSRMRSREVQTRMARYARVLAYSRNPLMRALARVAQAHLAGLGAILTHEEVASLYSQLESQLEEAISKESDGVDDLSG